MSNRISSAAALAYRGTQASNPPNWFIRTRDPLTTDNRNVSLGDLWMNKITREAWILVSLAGNNTNHGQLIAIWLQISKNIIATLTGNNSSVHVPADSMQNINVIGDGTTITVAGNTGTNTLTFSLVGGLFGQNLIGNSGGSVSADSSGNINIIGDGTTITFTGNPLTNTLTASILNPVDLTITGNSGGPVFPDLSGNYDFVGDGTTVTIVGTPGTGTLTMSLIPTGIDSTMTGDTGGAVSAGAGNTLLVLGGTGILTEGTPIDNLVNITQSNGLATIFQTDSGTAVPAGEVLDIHGGLNINTTGATNVVTTNLDTSLSGITNLTVTNLTVNTSATLGFLTEGVVQTNSSGTVFSSEGTDGQTLISSTTGAPTWNTFTAGSNISIINAANSITVSKSGTGGNGWVHIATGGLSAFTTGITTDYKTLLVVIEKIGIILGPGDYNISCNISDNGGVSYYNTNYLSGFNTWDVRQISPPGFVNVSANYGFLMGLVGTTPVVPYGFASGSYYIYNYGGRFTRGWQASGVYTGPLAGPVNALSFTAVGGPSVVTSVISLYGLTS